MNAIKEEWRAFWRNENDARTAALVIFGATALWALILLAAEVIR